MRRSPSRGLVSVRVPVAAVSSLDLAKRAEEVEEVLRGELVPAVRGGARACDNNKRGACG